MIRELLILTGDRAELVGGSGPGEGNVFLDGSPVCDDGWGSPDATVACRMAGWVKYIYRTGQQNTQGFVKFQAVQTHRHPLCQYFHLQEFTTLLK